jgi:hypothetical protein
MSGSPDAKIPDVVGVMEHLEEGPYTTKQSRMNLSRGPVQGLAILEFATMTWSGYLQEAPGPISEKGDRPGRAWGVATV